MNTLLRNAALSATTIFLLTGCFNGGSGGDKEFVTMSVVESKPAGISMELLERPNDKSPVMVYSYSNRDCKVNAPETCFHFSKYELNSIGDRISISSPLSPGGFDNQFIEILQAGKSAVVTVDDPLPAPGQRIVYFKKRFWMIGGLYSIVTGVTDGDNDPFNDYNPIWSSEDGINWVKEKEIATFPVRRDHQVVEFQDKLFLIGGRNQERFFNDIWVSRNGTEWEKVSPKQQAIFSPRSEHSVAVFDGKIWLFGGFSFNVESPVNDIWSSPDGENWTLVRNDGHTSLFRRAGASFFAYKGKLWIMGGYYFPYRSNARYFSDIWSSSDGITWTSVLNDDPRPQGHKGAQVVQYGDKLYLTGGMSFASYPGIPANNIYQQRIKGIWVSDNGWDWKLLRADEPYAPRSEHQVVVAHDKMYLFRGSTSSANGWSKYLADAWVSDDGYDWLEHKKILSFTGRDKQATYTFNNKIWVVGGESDGYLKNDIWSYDGKFWRKEVHRADFLPRALHTPVKVGDKMYLVGGYGYCTVQCEYSTGPGPNTSLAEIWSSIDGKKWTRENQSFIAEQGMRMAPMAAEIGSERMVVFGGGRNEKTRASLISASTRNFSDYYGRLSPADIPQMNRQRGRTAYFKNNIVMAGGRAYKRVYVYWGQTEYLERSFNDVWYSARNDGVYWGKTNPTADHIGPNRDNHFSRRYSHGLISYNDKLYLIGGTSSMRSYGFGDVWQSDDMNNWNNLQEIAPFGKRREFGTAVFDDRMWVIGGSRGQDATYENDVWSSKNGINWSKHSVWRIGIQ